MKGWEYGELLFHGYSVSVLQDEVLSNNVNILNINELCIFKWLRESILCYMYFTIIKKKTLGSFSVCSSTSNTD